MTLIRAGFAHATRFFHHGPATLSSMLSALALCVFASSAHATLTVDIDATTVSYSESTDSSTFQIYGGLGGKDCTSTNGSTTCNNCVDNGQTDENRLSVCNKKRIYPKLPVKITVKSDAIDGRPALIYVGANGDANSVIPTTNGDSPTTVSKGTSYTLNIYWSDICSRLVDSTSGTTSDDSCTITNDQITGNFQVGFSPGTGTPDLGQSTAEKATVTVTVRKTAGASDTTNYKSVKSFSDCQSYYTCAFKMNSGDAKATVVSFTHGDSFPNQPNLQFNWVRILYEKASGTTPFTKITPASPYQDLLISSDGSSLQSNSVGLDNGYLYVFKTALVDKAGNTGFYTPDSDQSGSCTDGQQKVCDYTAVPGEVVGVLANKVSCFIATAAYGSWMAPEVNVFRAFRTRFLLPTKWGQTFVKYYYQYSPYYAGYIANSPILRGLARLALAPLLAFAWLSLQVGAGVASLISITTLITVFLALRWCVRRLRAQKMRATRA